MGLAKWAQGRITGWPIDNLLRLARGRYVVSRIVGLSRLWKHMSTSFANQPKNKCLEFRTRTVVGLDLTFWGGWTRAGGQKFRLLFRMPGSICYRTWARFVRVFSLPYQHSNFNRVICMRYRFADGIYFVFILFRVFVFIFSFLIV